MAITGTITNYVRPRWKTTEESKVEFEFKIYGTSTGDASGGTNLHTLTMSNLHPNAQNYYLLLTELTMYTNDANVSALGLYLSSHALWEEYNVPGTTGANLYLHEFSVGVNGLTDAFYQPFYVGKPITGAAALVIDFGVNTDTKLYKMLLKGIALKEPKDLFHGYAQVY